MRLYLNRFILYVKKWSRTVKLFPAPSSKQEYPECDGIRGVAILLVFWFHYLLIFNVNLEETSWLNFPKIIAFSGAYGVQLFFVLSAYLLFLPQYKRIKHGGSPQKLSHFVIRRFFRIAPLYYLSTLSLLYLVNVGISQPNKFKHAYVHLLFIHIFFPETVFSVNNVTWSIGVEFIFYLCLPFLVFLLFSAHQIKLRRLKTTLISTIFIFLFLISILILFQASNVISASAISFFSGIIAVLVTLHIHEHHIKIRYINWIGPVIIVTIIGIHYGVYLETKKSPQLFHEVFVNKLYLISVLYAVVVIIASQKDKFLYPILSFYPLRIVGLFSYEIYIIHIFIIRFWAISIFDASQTEHVNAIIFGNITFLVTIIIGAILHIFISRPFIKISGFMIRRSSGQKLPSWMKFLLTLFFISIVIPTILLIP